MPDFPLWLTIIVILSGWVYLRGWFAIRKTRAAQFSLMRLNCFLLGLVVLWIALASLDDLADASLSAHMVQHLLLHVRCSAAAAAGLAGCSALARIAVVDTQAGSGSAAASRRTPAPWPLAHFAAGSVDGDELGLPWLACAGGLRFCFEDTSIGTSSNTSVSWQAHSPFGGASSSHGQPRSDGIAGDGWCCTCFRRTW